MTRTTCLRLVGMVVLAALTLGRPAPAVGAAEAATPASDRSAPVQAPRAQKWSRTELYFGSLMPNGDEVTQEAFDSFLAAEVSQRFPNGLTLLTGRGEYLNSTGQHVQERAYVVILLYPRREAGSSAAIEEIRAAYKQAFSQESVLRVDSIARVSF